jgi:UDP-N-acetylmuramoyl-tripeptide--D-alanyl-D-alanine ligase
VTPQKYSALHRLLSAAIYQFTNLPTCNFSGGVNIIFKTFSIRSAFSYFRGMVNTEQLYKYFLESQLVSTDTRNLPLECIFFALKGPSYNGNLFAMQALENGASYAVVDENVGEDPRLLLVENVLKSLQDLATYHRQVLDIHVLAITGSNGKTTTKELCHAVLKKDFEAIATIGNLNNHIGVPLTLLRLSDEHDFAIVEMGANHQQEIAALCQIAQPDYGLITNIGKAHLEGFGGIEGVKKGKGEMYDYLRSSGGLIFVHLDNTILREQLRGYDSIVTYGESTQAQYRGGIVPSLTTNLEVEITHPFELTIKTKFTGDYNFQNIMCAVAIGAHFGVDPFDIKEAIENYIPDNHRSQIIKKDQLTIVQDAYNANPSSMKAALDNFKKHFSGSKIVALGEMLELGNAAADEHLKVAEEAAALSEATLLLVGKLFEAPSKKIKSLHFESSQQCMEWLKENKPTSGSILIKGSRGSQMEKLLEAF